MRSEGDRKQLGEPRSFVASPNNERAVRANFFQAVAALKALVFGAQTPNGARERIDAGPRGRFVA